MERTCGNGTLRLADAGKKVTLIGWVQRRRNFGALVFIDLRDRSGLVQVVFDETLSDSIKDVRSEYILQVTGTVVQRKEANPKMETGEIEVHAEAVNIINSAATPPIMISDDTDALEDTRLKYRYLDLRRPSLQKILMTRHKVCMITRKTLDSMGFVEVETPILARSTPEGARDYLVPSRLYNGKFWALPQSPQIYKQLLMIGGMEKYFQIARCFRDEDLRADRQPTFTQIDVEMSFVDENDVFAVVEKLMQEIFMGIRGYKVEDHFVRMTWDECMKRYGSDKPDLRYGYEIQNISEIFADTEFTVFKTVLENKGEVDALKFDQAASKYSRKKLDELQEFIKHNFRAKALAWLKMEKGELSGSIVKAISDAEKQALIAKLAITDDDLVLIVADKPHVAETALGALRIRLAHELDRLPKEETYKFLWVTDFPMYEWDEEGQRWQAAHHPFTAPRVNDINELFTDPEHVMSRAYDLVLNGYEQLSGSIRIYDQNMQEKVFESIGMTMEQAHQKFGFFLDAFQYGTPPHGGFAIGLERLIMVLCGTDNIRDVVAFPTNNSAVDLMSDSPNVVDQAQLDILGLSINKKD
ncbi:MAG: aspartate--tRNA ligase [Solobacterium sp.]|nr:aspartate--tRNA ligase [Solobacterium sp.]MBR3127202.1 aspartate--tRNA ligase [Solobacterium sp.]